MAGKMNMNVMGLHLYELLELEKGEIHDCDDNAEY